MSEIITHLAFYAGWPNAFLQFNEYDILNNSGKVTAEIAKAFAESEFKKYRIVQDRLFESDFDKLLKELEWFISCTVNGNLTLLGIWGSGNYIEDIYVYLQIHKEKLQSISNVLLGGDFNSNSNWDKEHKRGTHSAVVKQLGDVGLTSCYYEIANEVQGQES